MQSSGAQTISMTLVTVCVAPELAEAALQAADGRGWALQEAHFDGYISARKRPHLGAHLRSGDGCVALVDFDRDPHAAVEAATFLHAAFPQRLVVIAVSSANTPELILLAMRAGCKRVSTHAPRRREDMDRALARVEEQLLSTLDVTHAAGSVLAFFGAKGGVGSTTLALHLATFLAQNHARKVLLIDNHRAVRARMHLPGD